MNSSMVRSRISDRMIVIGSAVFMILCAILCSFFYNAMKTQIYEERKAYLSEITEQMVKTVNTITAASWEHTIHLANDIVYADMDDAADICRVINTAEKNLDLTGAHIYLFDEENNYYASDGIIRKGDKEVLALEKKEKKVVIRHLPFLSGTKDQMAFIMELPRPVFLKKDNIKLTKLSLIREMDSYAQALKVQGFNNSCVNYIITDEGERVYRDNELNQGESFDNVLYSLENTQVLHADSFEEFKENVRKGRTDCIEINMDGTVYFVSCCPLQYNNWQLLMMVPSDEVIIYAKGFMMNIALCVGAIAGIILLLIALTGYMTMSAANDRRMMAKQKEYNEALFLAAEEAKRANKAKSRFLSNMTHDVRTPINAIIGMTNIAFNHINNEEKVRDCLNKILLTSQHLFSLINDVLDMSRIESGKVEMENNPFEMERLLNQCVSIIDVSAHEKKQKIHKEYSGLEHKRLVGDSKHLCQILINILGNAVKFTPEEGNICICVREKEIKDDTVSYVFEIKDDGIGISEEFKEHIFEPFAQENSAYRTHYEGTGLGMAIVHSLIELMGGRLELESELGKGSCFRIYLNFNLDKSPQMNHEPIMDKMALNGMHILLVEDNELNLEIAQDMLEEQGAQVSVAKNGQEAVDLFTQSAKHEFDMILMDVMMPVMDGIEATRTIRALPREDGSTVLIIAMTANSYDTDVREAMEAGMNEYVTKPINRGSFVRMLAGYRRENKEIIS